MSKFLILMSMIAMVIAACTGDAVEEAATEEAETIAQVATDVVVVEDPTEVVVEPTVEEVVVEPTLAPTTVPPTPIPPTAEPTTVPETSAYNAPEWTNLPLVNARTGETFTLADFAGKTVFIEPMATWCTNCRAQQTNVAQAMTQLNADEFVFISLSVGENVSDTVLADYADRNGFPQVFAGASDDITRALVDTFGFSVTSPPSTPHFTISPIGTVSSLSTGRKSADSFVQEALTVQGS
ncbi:MAG: redoxin domain-containing protein [Chloroflexota bacterium]